MQRAFNVFVRAFGYLMAVIWLVASTSTASAQSNLPTMSATYDPSTVTAGDATSITYQITNNDTSRTTDLAFTHTLPGDLTIGAGAVTSSCGSGTVTAATGGTTITLANGFVERNVSCSVVVPIATASVGSVSNNTGDLTSSLGNSGPTPTNTLTTNAPPVTPLVLVQSIAPSSVPIGGKSTLTFTFDNSASAIAVGSFSFNDTMPAGMTFDPDGIPTNNCVNPNPSFPPEFTVDNGNNSVSLFASGFTFGGFEVLPAGATCQITLPLIGSTEGNFNNASAGATYSRAGASNLTTNPTTAAFSVVGSPPGAPLMVKAFTDDPANPGGTVTARYTISNQDRNFPATDLAFSDDLDAALSGLTFTSLLSNSCGGSVAGVGTGLLSFSGGSLAPGGASCVITASLTTPSAAAGSYPSPTGTVSATIDGATVTGNSASDSLILRGATPPTATVSFTDTSPGGTTTMTLVITNQSNSLAASNIDFSTTFSGGFPVTSANSTPLAGDCGGSSTFTFTNATNFPPPSDATPASLSMSDGSLAGGASCTLTWVLNVRPDAPGGTFTNTSDAITATVGTEPVTGGTATGTLTVGGGVNLDFVKSFSGTTAPGGTVNVIFQLSSAADSVATATAINFTDDVDAMLSGTTADVGAATNTCGGVLGGTPSEITFASGSLAPGASCEISVPLTIPASAANGTYANITTPLFATPTGGTAQNFGTASADLSVFSLTGTGTFTPNTVIAGETTSVSYTFTNSGGDDVTSLTFTFDANNIHSGSTLGAVATTNTCSGTYTPLGASFGIYSGGTVTAGGFCVLEVPVNVAAAATPGTKTQRTSNVTGQVNGSGVTFDPVSALLTVDNAVLNFSKVFGSASVQAGSVTTLTFTAENTNASTSVSNLAFTDNLEADFVSGATVLGQVSNGCGGTISGIGTGLLSYSGGTLAANGTCDVAITVQLPSGSVGSFQNVSSDLTGQLSGLAVRGDAARATLNVTSATPPTFVKSFSPDTLDPNNSTTVSYTITNPAGGASLTGLQFSDPLGTDIPGATLTYPATSGVCGTGSSVSGGSTLLLSGGNLAPGASCTFTATVAVPLISARTVTSTSDVLRDNGLQVAAGASDDLTITQPRPGFAQAFAPTNIAQGGVSTLTYTVDNSGSADTAGSLSFNTSFPSGVTIASTPNASSTCGGMGNATGGAVSFAFAGGSIAAGSTCTVQFDVTSQTVGDANQVAINLSSSAGTSTAAATTLTVDAAPAPGFTAVFSPATVNQGENATLTYTVDNGSALITAASLDFTTSLPAGMVVADTPNSSTTCAGGTITSVAASGSVAYTGGSVSAGASCTVQVDVRAIGSGSLIATSGDLTSSLGNSGTAAATLTVNAAPAPAFTKAFTPATIDQGEQSSLVLTIDNTGSAIEATALDFTDTFPAGMTATAAPGAATTCTGGTVTAASNGNSVSYTGGTIAAGASCTVSLAVTSATAGPAVNTSGDLTSSLGNNGTAGAILTVNAAAAPAFTAAFAPGSIAQGDTSTLRFTIDSTTAQIPVTALDFSNTLPAGVTIAATPNASTTCTSGTLTASAGAGTLSYTGGTVAALSSCTVQVDVTSATTGAVVNTSGDLTSSQGNSGTATANLTVNAAPAPAFSAEFAPDSIVQGATSTLTFTIDSTSALIDVTALDFTNTFPAGVTIAASPNTSTTCTSGTLTGAAGAASLSYTGGTVTAGASCTVQVDVTSATAGAAVNTSGDLTSSQGNSGTATDTLTVNAAPAPAFSMSVTPGMIDQGAVTTVRFDVDNAAALISADNLGFDFALPAGVDFASPLNFSSDCAGGAATPISGGARLTSTTLAAGAACFAQFDVTASNAGSTVFTTGDLTSSLGNSGTASTTLSVTAAGVPNFSASFAPSPIVQGDVSTLSFVIDNAANLVAAENGAFSNTFPAGMTVAATPNYVASCTGGASTAGTDTFTAGGSSLDLTGIEVGPSASCSYAIDVTTATTGSSVNTSGDLVTSLGNSGPAAAVLEVTGAPVPDFTGAYSPDTVVQGGNTTLVFTIDNAASLIEASGLGFSSRLPSGVLIADPLNLSTTCAGGTVNGSAGSTGFLFSGGTVAAGGSCTVSAEVTASTAGILSETSSVLSSSQGDTADGATATLTVTGAPAPDFTAAYTPATIVQGDVATLVYTIDNAAALVEAATLAFAETLPAGVTVATTPNVTNDCGGTLSAAAGSSSIDFNGGTVAAGAQCSIQFDVTSVTVGDVTGTAGPLTSSLGDSGTATSNLSVTGAQAPLFAKAFAPASIVQGDVSTLTFTIDNSAALIEANTLAFTDPMPGGMVVAATPNISNSCTGGTLTAAAGDSSIVLADALVDASSTCTISVDVTRADSGTVTNVTGDLTSSLGNSGAASDVLTTTAAAAPAFTKAFSPTTIVQGEVSTLTFTIDNAAALVEATALSFSDNMPSGMTVAATPNVTNTCTDGAVTATADSSSISFSGATVAASASCTVSVDVTLVTVGDATNVTEDLTSSLGNSGAATAVLTATAATAPTFAKVFNPSSIAQGEVSTLTFTINNAAAAVDATDLAFIDTFPSGMVIANSGASTTCSSGSLSAATGTGTVTYSGGTVAAGASCEVVVNVTAANVQTYNNTSGDLTSSLGNSGTASASLTVTPSSAPGFSGSYSPPSIPQGGISRLTLTIDNTANSVPAGSLGFNVTLPSGVTIDDQPRPSGFVELPDASSTCGGSVTALGGSSTVSLSGGNVAAASTCTVSVNVTSQNVGPTGQISGSLSSSLGSSSVAPGAPLVVVVNPQGRVTFVQNSSEDGTFTFSSTEAALNFSITTAGGSGSRGPINLTQGTYVVTQSRPAGVGNTAVSCTDNDSVGDPGSGTLTLTVGPNEAVTCTFTSLSTAQKTTEVINSFLQRRNNLILSNGPTRARRLARLSQGVGGSETLSFQRGDLQSFSPVNFNLRSAASGNYEISTSLYQIERSAMMFALAHDGIEGNTAVFNPRRFDVWFEAHYNEFKASQGSSGHFGIAYLGADYLITPDLLAGVMLQFDSLDDESTVNNSSISGTGWMIGPYVTARVAPNLIFDGRLAYGQSTNEVSPFNTYTDEFDTDRFLIDASLSGNFDWDNWVVTPTLSISYIEERQHSYIDSLNVVIPEQKVSLGQIKFGPTFSTTIQGDNHRVIEPSFTLNGIYNFGNRSGPLITNNTADETNGLRARVEAAVRVTNRNGTRFEFGANYDGIGQSDFESWGANVKLTIPLQ